MRLTGTLKSWNDDRGFGFIAPTNGSREVFVHISAFPRDGSRPIVGESLTFELGYGKDGKPRAIRVYRETSGSRSTHSRTRPAYARRRRSPLRLIGTALLIAAAVYGYITSQRQPPHTDLLTPASEVSGSSLGQYRCDGRTHCSQMTSCEEAKFFLQNCPGTKMDGNNDGVPCETQWCK